MLWRTARPTADAGDRYMSLHHSGQGQWPTEEMGHVTQGLSGSRLACKCNYAICDTNILCSSEQLTTCFDVLAVGSCSLT